MTTTIEELQIIPSGGIVTGSGNGTDVTPWIDTSYLVTPATNSHLSDLAGRVLSSKSMQYAKAAFEALRELLASAEKEKETPDEDMPMDMADGFYFVDLGLTPGQRFAGFALGKFVDMHGRAVEFTKESIDKFLSNTIKAIAAAKGKRMPGLPIDSKGHDKGEAAGWIVDAELGEVKDSVGGVIPAIYLAAEWTSLGVRLLSEKILTNFSPTVDLTNQTIRGGSLTNWPASVDANGVPLFHAIELSNRAGVDDGSQPALLSGEKTMAIELTQEQLEELVSKRVDAALTEAVNTTAKDDGNAANRLTELVEAKVNARWQEKIELMQRESAAAELAREVTEKGIPYSANTLTAELTKLNPAQAEFWGGVLKTVANNGLTSFAEMGHGGRITGKQLEPEIKRVLDAHVKQGGTVEDFFAFAGIGEMGDYNLSAYQGGK